MGKDDMPKWAEKMLENQEKIIDNLMQTQSKLFEKHGEVMGMVTNLAETVGALTGTVVTLTETMTSLTEQMARLVQSGTVPAAKGVDNLPSLAAPSSMKAMAYAAVVKAHLDAPTIEAKAKNIVICNVGELDDKGEEIKGLEGKLVSELITNCGDKTLEDQWKKGEITFRRHPETRPPTARGRPIKVFLKSQADRDLLLGHARRHKPATLRSFPHSFIRRDYTREELAADRDLRERAGTLNATFGELKYVVRDFEICTLANPRPLPKRPPARPQKPKV